MSAVIAAATKDLDTVEDILVQLQTVAGRATTADRLISAEVDSSGALVALTLADGVTRLDPHVLARRIVRACAYAADKAAAQHSAILENLNVN